MNNPNPRPVYLNLLQIRLPLGGVLSIFHRVSGVLLVLAIPFLIYLLQLLNGGTAGYTQASHLLQSIPGKVVTTISIWLLIQHSLSGIRHLLMDMGYSYNKAVARNTAITAFVISFVLIILSGVLIWR